MIQPIIFGKFILLERVSVGGMAEVYRAKLLNAPDFERFFAIKRILPHLAADKDFVTMFINEAKVAVELEHPNVCQIYELGRLGQSHYIAMEYIAGRDVQAIQSYYRKHKKIMSISQACFIIAQAAQGLDYAHRAVDASGQPLGLVHRDVSPQNLLVTYDGVVKLIDFGVSKAARKTTHSKSGVLKGKFSYMSPEQAVDGPIDHRSDIFALGVVFWELLTGRRLFQSESEFAILEMISECKIEKPSKYNRMIPEAVERICMKALEKDVSKRYAWASEMVIDLLEFINSCKTPFTQWHLQTWMCKAFEAEFQGEWEKIPIFKQLNTPEDVEKYNIEHAEEYRSLQNIQALSGDSDDKNTESEQSQAAQSISSNISAASESDASSAASTEGAAESEDSSSSQNTKSASISDPVKSAASISKPLPNVKSVNLNIGSNVSSEKDTSGQKLSISSSSLNSENDDDLELEPEGIAPSVSDPQILKFKREEKKARTRKGLIAFIIVICTAFIACPILLTLNIIKAPMPAVILPTSASLYYTLAPDSPEAKVTLYATPKDDNAPIKTVTGNTPFTDLPAGNYTITVDMPGYEQESFLLTLENGKFETRFDMTHPLPLKTRYTVNVTPEDARLYVNGVLVSGQGSQRTIDSTVGEAYTIRAIKLGYEPKTLSGNVEENMALNLELSQSGDVSMQIASDPPHSSVIIYADDKVAMRGETPMTIPKVDISAPMTIEIQHPGLPVWKKEIDFSTIETSDIRFFADLKHN